MYILGKDTFVSLAWPPRVVAVVPGEASWRPLFPLPPSHSFLSFLVPSFPWPGKNVLGLESDAWVQTVQRPIVWPQTGYLLTGSLIPPLQNGGDTYLMAAGEENQVNLCESLPGAWPSVVGGASLSCLLMPPPSLSLVSDQRHSSALAVANGRMVISQAPTMCWVPCTRLIPSS